MPNASLQYRVGFLLGVFVLLPVGTTPANSTAPRIASGDNGHTLRISPMGVRAGLRARPFTFAQLVIRRKHCPSWRRIRARLDATVRPHEKESDFDRRPPCRLPPGRRREGAEPGCAFRSGFPGA